jgi:nucleoside phosphorylase
MDHSAFRECWAAARGLRAAEHAADVIEHLRPHTQGFFRTRAPLGLQLHRAAREGRLIWYGPGSFAVLQAPADRPIEGAGRMLRWIDRQWALLTLAGAFLAFVLSTALLTVALRAAIGVPAAVLGVSVAGLVLVAYVASDQLAAVAQMLLRGLRSLARNAPRPDETAAETLPYERWSMVVCHHDGDDRTAAALLDEVERRLVGLAGDDAVLACPTAGITTGAMRDRVAGWAAGQRFGEGRPAVSVRLPRRAPARRSRVSETGAFFFVYLAIAALGLVSFASTVNGMERSGCAAGCAARPATFTAALRWTWYRLVFQDPPGVHPATVWARMIGVMIGVFLPLTVFMAAASISHYWRYRAHLRKDFLAMMDEALGRDRILLVVATETERTAVLDWVHTRCGTRAGPDFSGRHPVYRLGVIGEVELVLAQCGPGVTSPVSTAYSVPELIADWRPRYVILLGICYGLREEKQRLGDVIVGRRLQVVNLRVGEQETRDRGDAITAGHRLVERFEVAEPPEGVRVWPGTLLSWDVLVDFAPLRAWLRERYGDALGGEMEGAAVAAASVREGVEWIVVKGICDWGQGKSDEAQQLAASNAAALVLDLVEARAFAHRHRPVGA